MSVWHGSPGVRYSEEFRKIVYDINPVYLPCVYKEMFENNATNRLRDLEDTREEDLITNPKEDSNVKNGSNTTQKTKYPSSAFSDIQNKQIKTRCSEAVFLDHKNKQDQLGGWEICSKTHSAASRIIEDIKQRSQSASAKLGSLLTTTQKVGKTKDFKGRFCFSRPESDGKYISSDASLKTSDQIRSHVSQNTSLSTSPINYTFLHFDFPDNYIEQYRQEYTSKNLRERNGSNQKPCFCLRPYSAFIPSVPIMPMFRTTEQGTQDGQSLRVVSSFHTDSKTVTGRHELPKRKQATAKLAHVTEHQKSQDVHAQKSRNGVMKMELISNPLIMDKYTSLKSQTVCRTRPPTNSSTPGHVYPTSAVRIYRDVLRK